MKKILTLIGILGVLTVIYITTRLDDCLTRAGIDGTGRNEGAGVEP